MLINARVFSSLRAPQLLKLCQLPLSGFPPSVVAALGACALTCNSSYGTIPSRSTDFSTLDEEDESFFASIIGHQAVVTDPVALQPFNQDWMKLYEGKSSCVLLPTTTAQVQAILAHCHKRHLAVVPQGGNTGLVGGSVPVHDEVIISLAKMNRILSMDEVSGRLVCEAGCILQVLDEYCRERGYMMPLDLGAKGSCHIGGNVSTNAGNQH